MTLDFPVLFVLLFFPIFWVSFFGDRRLLPLPLCAAFIIFLQLLTVPAVGVGLTFTERGKERDEYELAGAGN